MAFYHPLEDSLDLDFFDDYADNTLAVLSGADIWDRMGVDHDLDFLPDFPQGGAWDFQPPPLDALDPAEVRLRAEVASLSDRLAARRRADVITRAFTLHDTFIVDPIERSASPSFSPPMFEDGEPVPVFPPESPRRVAAEVSAVGFMLATAAFWLSSVDLSTVSPEDQEELGILAGQAFEAAVRRFPRAHEMYTDSPTPAPADGFSMELELRGSASSMPADPPGRTPSVPNPDRPRRSRRRRR
jgi:hypothetical protein